MAKTTPSMRDAVPMCALYAPVRLRTGRTGLVVGAARRDEAAAATLDFKTFLALPSPYETLGLPRGARMDQEARKLAKCALLHAHPDKGGSTSRLDEVLRARRVLNHSRARKAYLVYGWAGVLAVWDGAARGAHPVASA